MNYCIVRAVLCYCRKPYCSVFFSVLLIVSSLTDFHSLCWTIWVNHNFSTWNIYIIFITLCNTYNAFDLLYFSNNMLIIWMISKTFHCLKWCLFLYHSTWSWNIYIYIYIYIYIFIYLFINICIILFVLHCGIDVYVCLFL